MAASEFSASAGGLLGTNDLQESIDKFDTAVSNLTSVVSQLGTDMGGGMTRHPAMGMMAEGQTFSHGSLNSLSTFASFLTPAQQRGAVILGQNGNSTSGTSSPQPTMNQGASGSGANGGGATFGAPTGGGNTPPTMGQTASGGGANGGGATFGGGSGGPAGPGGPTGPIGGPGGPGMGATPASFLSKATGALAGGVAAYGMGQYSTQLLFNAYGQQMAAQWGLNAQAAQNAAFGNGNGSVWNAAAGNAQSAAAAMSTLNSMSGGGTIGMGNPLAATNAFAFANQGLGAAGASQLASSMYSPVNSLQMMLLTGISPINPRTGQFNSLPSLINGLAGEGYIGGGGYNAATGTFNQKALKASFTPGRGTSWMALQSLGKTPQQIQDIQSTINQANQIAVAGHVKGGWNTVYNTMNTAEGGPGIAETRSQAATNQLHAWDPNFHLSTIQKQGNLSSLNMAESQRQSSTFNEAVSGATTAMTHFTQAVNWFLQKTHLDKALGLGGGLSAGVSSTGMSGFVSGIASTIGDVASMAMMGSGAASVSVTQPMTSMGSRAGSSMSSVSGQVSTAVRDAEAQVGKPYVWGGSSPQTSFDCSGLVMWAYDQAGVRLPRTSEQQWAALKNKSVSLNQVREGDIVFQAGSDGTVNAPGHEALMISSSQIVEAPYTGANIRIRGYNPNEWQHAGRPVGKGGGSGSVPVSGTQTGNTTSRLGAGNSGSMMTGGDGGDASLGLTTNADSLLFSGGLMGSSGSGTMATTTNGSATTTGLTSSGSAPVAGNGGSVQSLARQMAAKRGWTGSLWNDLNAVEMAEAGWNLHAQNPSSSAYGIAQFINGPSEYYQYGGNPNTASGQVTAFLNYVDQRYHGPAGAWAHEQQYHWYGSGTRSAAPGLALVGDRGPELIDLGGGGQQIHNAQATSNILRGTSAQTAQSPWTATPARQLLLDTLTSANDHAQAQGGVNITVQVTKGAITVTGNTGISSSSDVQTMADAFGQAIEDRLQKSELLRNIARGNTG